MAFRRAPICLILIRKNRQDDALRRWPPASTNTVFDKKMLHCDDCVSRNAAWIFRVG
jgi:hypothetical protein